jgi:hypothetical protein
VSNLQKAQQYAEKLRQEPYRLLTNDCITKSFRLRNTLKGLNIVSHVVICIGVVKANWFSHYITMPVIHAWCEVEGTRIETSRPLGSAGIWGIIPVNIRPVITVRF